MAYKAANGFTIINDSRQILNTDNVGINTNSLTTTGLSGYKGLYICNGMTFTDSTISQDITIGAKYNALMPGPLTVNATITVNGTFVVI